jgi:hypothetical protein
MFFKDCKGLLICITPITRFFDRLVPYQEEEYDDTIRDRGTPKNSSTALNSIYIEQMWWP